MSDLFTDWDWNQVLNSTEKWEEDNLVGEELNHASIDTSDEGREKDDIDIDDIQQLILTLENNDIRTAERQLLDAIKPHYYTATSDIWDNFYLRIPIIAVH